MVAPGRSARRWTLLGLLGLTAVIGFVGAALIRVPYYALRPGMVRDTGPMIELVGVTPDADAGDLAFATVAVDGRVNLLQAFAGWLDDTVAVVPEDRILQGQTLQQNVEHNQVLMADSKQLAIDTALTWLGLARPGGALVASVVAGSPAEPLLAVGDVVTAIDGVPVATGAALVERIRLARPGQVLQLDVVPAAGSAVVGSGGGRRLHAGELSTATRIVVTLGADDQDPTRARLGVNVRDAMAVSLDGDVRIDSGQVGGPSAGLGFTLGVLDALTPGDLTGGRRVVATGTIAVDGKVGPIGGIEQKAVAVRRSGAKVFLVPADQSPTELADARRLAGDVEIVPVHTLGEALAALEARGGGEVALAPLGG